MKIIIVSNYYTPEIGAAPSRISMLAEALIKSGDDVTVVCPLPNYPYGKIFDEYKKKIYKKEVINGVQVYRYWIYPSVSSGVIQRVLSMFSFSISHLFVLIEYWKIKEADWIIVQNSPLMVSFLAIAFLGKINNRIALNISDLWPLSALELGVVKKGRFYSLLEWIEKYNYKKAKLILGQSEGIISHVKSIVDRPSFLYRNYQKYDDDYHDDASQKSTDTFKIIYAGLLGVAQGVLSIIENIDFKNLQAELHIYGEGNEVDNIKSYIDSHPASNVFYCGILNKQDIQKKISTYNASIVPLRKEIKGAVPSKIFELAQRNVPILFCGGGEGAKMVDDLRIGYTSPPGDFTKLSENIQKIRGLSLHEYNQLVESCNHASIAHFNFDKQITIFRQTLINA